MCLLQVLSDAQEKDILNFPVVMCIIWRVIGIWEVPCIQHHVKPTQTTYGQPERGFKKAWEENGIL